MKYKISILFTKNCKSKNCKSKNCKLKTLKNMFNLACYIGNIDLINKFRYLGIINRFEKNDIQNALEHALNGEQTKIINYIYSKFGIKTDNCIIYLRNYNKYSGDLKNHTDYIVYKYLSKGRLPEDLMIKLVYYF